MPQFVLAAASYFQCAFAHFSVSNPRISLVKHTTTMDLPTPPTEFLVWDCYPSYRWYIAELTNWSSITIFGNFQLVWPRKTPGINLSHIGKRNKTKLSTFKASEPHFRQFCLARSLHLAPSALPLLTLADQRCPLSPFFQISGPVCSQLA